MAISENSKLVFKTVAAAKEDVTANDIAALTGLTSRQVVGSVNAFVKKELMTRVPADAVLEDGTHKTVNLIKMTEKGLATDIDAAE